MFKDECEILVRAGKGGNGLLCFRRETHVPRGGPDGGDGGDGGSVFVEASMSLNTLTGVAFKRRFSAGNGMPGGPNNRGGKDGRDVFVKVPVGTQVYDRDTGFLLRDLKAAGDQVCVARGGRGGFGNKHFASSVDQAPRKTTNGGEGEQRKLRLELKLIADVGLAGLPNAGKSTLLSRLSNARPKIADYPFTTLTPMLGIVDTGDFSGFVMADIPGLIEGAHGGAGLGDKFLRHIERTRAVLHVIDMDPPEGLPRPAEAFLIVKEELGKYSPELASKPFLVVANKMDLTGAKKNLAKLKKACGAQVFPVSAATGEGLKKLVNGIAEFLREHPPVKQGSSSILDE